MAETIEKIEKVFYNVRKDRRVKLEFNVRGGMKAYVNVFYKNPSLIENNILATPNDVFSGPKEIELLKGDVLENEFFWVFLQIANEAGLSDRLRTDTIFSGGNKSRVLKVDEEDSFPQGSTAIIRLDTTIT